jgi:hypothetical protein
MRASGPPDPRRDNSPDLGPRLRLVVCYCYDVSRGHPHPLAVFLALAFYEHD